MKILPEQPRIDLNINSEHLKEAQENYKKQEKIYIYRTNEKIKRPKKDIIAAVAATAGFGFAGGISGASFGVCAGILAGGAAGPIGVAIGGISGGIIGGTTGTALGITGGVVTGKMILRESTEYQNFKTNVMTEKVRQEFHEFVKKHDLLQDFICYYSCEIFEFPVRGPDNVVYDKKSIYAWIDKKNSKGVGVASAFGQIDFKKKDLVFDYKTAINLNNAIIRVLNEENGPWKNPKVKMGLIKLRQDIEIELGHFMNEWIEALYKRYEEKHEEFSVLVQKYAVVANEMQFNENNLEKIEKKISEIMKKNKNDSWDKENIEYFQSCFRSKTPAYLYSKENEDLFC